jgi:hypothetical protein
MKPRCSAQVDILAGFGHNEATCWAVMPGKGNHIMKRILSQASILIVLLALASCGLSPAPTTSPTFPPQPTAEPTSPSRATDSVAAKAPLTATPLPTATLGLPTATPTAAPPISSPTVAPTASTTNPFELVSLDRLLGTIEDLTAIQPYSGWRNSASSGEAEALEYVANRLGELSYLSSLGLELESQDFHVFLGTELWDSRLVLSVNGEETEVPADGLRGPRDNIAQALRFDSDGSLNDSDPNPLVAEGDVVTIRSADEIQSLDPDALQAKVVFLDYAVVDRSVMDTTRAVGIATELLEKGPSGLVLVTSFSNQPDESHGAFVADSSAFDWVETASSPPILHVRLEDLASAGIEGWQDMGSIETARLTLDSDVFSPAPSSNLIAHIPGSDPTQAIILGAHIDSPNSPGAMDDGSGSAVLLEVARVLNDARVQPPYDVYLAWFGSEELGLYGASNFVATHQDLLDRTKAMLQIDCLTRPLDGLKGELKLVSWPYGRLGDERLVWPDYLSQMVEPRGIDAVPEAAYYVYSDNSSFGGFDVPHADLIYEPVVNAGASVHYAGHIHDPYDTVDLASEEGDFLEQMTHVALAAALDAEATGSDLRVTPPADRRALFVASHTEAPHMTPVTFTEMGMALALEGFDVDLLPYGQAVTADALQDADLVIVLPVLDFPVDDNDPNLYDEAWTPEEISALEAYVAEGGLLVLTNSAHRLKYGNHGLDRNEDWDALNDLASRFGITYENGTISGNQASAVADHPLLSDVTTLEIGPNNGIPFTMSETVTAQVLVEAKGQPVVALVDPTSGGQVIVLADVGIFTTSQGVPSNLTFWRNLARYAR